MQVLLWQEANAGLKMDEEDEEDEVGYRKEYWVYKVMRNSMGTETGAD